MLQIIGSDPLRGLYVYQRSRRGPSGHLWVVYMCYKDCVDLSGIVSSSRGLHEVEIRHGSITTLGSFKSSLNCSLVGDQSSEFWDMNRCASSISEDIMLSHTPTAAEHASDACSSSRLTCLRSWLLSYQLPRGMAHSHKSAVVPSGLRQRSSSGYFPSSTSTSHISLQPLRQRKAYHVAVEGKCRSWKHITIHFYSQWWRFQRWLS